MGASNYPPGVKNDPSAPWNQDDDGCANCGEETVLNANDLCKYCAREGEPDEN